MSVAVGLVGLIQVVIGIILLTGERSPIGMAVGGAIISVGLLLYGLGVVIWHLSGIKGELRKANAARTATGVDRQSA